MDDFELLIDLHKWAIRQGPGGDVETKRAIELALLDPVAPLRIADIGCGTGASVLQLARSLNADIKAVDFSSEFLEVLMGRALKDGLEGKIEPVLCSMDKLQFDDEEFDVIWSEGAIYNIGFEQGINNWRRFLKPGGVLAVSEITWISGDRPAQIQRYWEAEYPEIDTASAKIKLLEKGGYSPVGYFVLPERCWLQNYYRPMQAAFEDFLLRNSRSEQAQAIVAAEEREIALYEEYGATYSYGFYIARKSGGRSG